jgi:hypothetical protein
MPFTNYEGKILLFVYSKKHDETDRNSLSFRYEIAEKCPLFKGKPYTSAIIIGEGLNPETLTYFEQFDDAVVVGTGTINDIIPGE